MLGWDGGQSGLVEASVSEVFLSFIFEYVSFIYAFLEFFQIRTVVISTMVVPLWCAIANN